MVNEFILDHADDDTYQLALHRKLYPQLTDEDMAFALQQIENRQKAKHKLPSFYNNHDILYPSRLAMEQCSSETTARYKASLLAAFSSAINPINPINPINSINSLADLTGGFGIDTFHLSQHFKTTHYVEPNTQLCNIASHNFKSLNAGIITHNTTAEDFLVTTDRLDWIYIDPSRRDNAGRKVFRLQDCEPNLLELWDLIQSKSRCQMIKLSPMVDIKSVFQSPLRPQEIHIVAIDNECKEVLCVCKNSDFSPSADGSEFRLQNLDFRLQATNINRHGSSTFRFSLREEQDAVATYADGIHRYLYEPDAAILKAGAYKLVSQRYGIAKLAPNTHLYTSDRLIPGFQGRIFKVSAVNPDTKTITGMQANVIARNYPLSPQQIQKKYRIKDGGDNYLIATTIGNRKVIFGTQLLHGINRDSRTRSVSVPYATPTIIFVNS